MENLPFSGGRWRANWRATLGLEVRQVQKIEPQQVEQVHAVALPHGFENGEFDKAGINAQQFDQRRRGTRLGHEVTNCRLGHVAHPQD
jgi:hypothetical protein